jgi:RNA polymerase sigma factor (sigma-70 family)
VARQITQPSNVEDLVSEAFIRMLRVLQEGGGPDSAFRAYLLSTIRRINIDLARGYYRRVTLTDDERELDAELQDSAADVLAEERRQRTVAWKAWAALPESSRMLLWHALIEEETPAQIAPLLGSTPNAVSSRLKRAKERLRQNFLQQHLLAADNEDCHAAVSRLGEYVRGALSETDRVVVAQHLAGCLRCAAARAEVSDINGTLRLGIAPLVLGGPSIAAAYRSAKGGRRDGRANNLAAVLLRTTAGRATVALLVLAGLIAGISYIFTSSTGQRPRPQAMLGAAPPPTLPAGDQPSRRHSGPAGSALPTPHPPRTAPSSHPTYPSPSPSPGSTRTVDFELLVAESTGQATLLITTPKQWTIHAVTGPPQARCVTTAATATCTLSNVAAGQYPFRVTATGPLTTPRPLLHTAYTDRAGTITTDLPL